MNFQELGDATNSLPEHVLLDVVWSLTVLGKVKDDQLEAVLNPTFYNVILCKSLNRCLRKIFICHIEKILTLTEH